MVRFRRLTLDYDNITEKELMKRIKFIFKDRLDITKIKVFASPRLDGYHVYCYFDSFITIQKMIYLRHRYKDDGKRIVIDLLKSNDLEKMVLFESKGHKDYEFKEIPMYEFWQNNHYELPKIIS